MNNEPQPTPAQTPEPQPAQPVQPNVATQTPDAIVAPAQDYTIQQPAIPPAQPPAKKPNKRKVIMVVAALLVVVAAGAGGYVYYQNSQQPQTTTTDASSKDKTATPTATPLVGTVPDITTKPDTIPSGWVKFTSKKFGLSFATPKDWTVTESDQSTADLVSYSISVFPKNDATIGIYIVIIKKDLKELTEPPAGAKTEDAQSGTSVATLKWNGYDAAIASITSTYPDGKTYVGKNLIVQAGPMLYQLPAKDGQSPGIILKKITQQDWDAFNDTLVIKP